MKLVFFIFFSLKKSRGRGETGLLATNVLAPRLFHQPPTFIHAGKPRKARSGRRWAGVSFDRLRLAVEPLC